ncbi:MCP four helix bundle domain-containing protein [Pandoraea nosoerga]|uniref:Chemotaxis protein CheA n=1 Tax=Pandoraea nosoerga TaxID=2508296 RepID=A0A5E4XQT8_9BURK|nr:MCP four helix bundle domain-containing protein [Pandoraea nosoerga]MBN4667347.1 MCP four helix bundle domain-containing protein [Pandoraea nosoerga]MBN4677338.1 MCP four helix bundle domain-containing protein [Pandoraea nosoerga]MBN4682459.1 MCP four helix bundle domain-containing protein [Pandoraea nosoerga]MBN4746744.1 MCP four helix bundle domain-containing protein [Pandoraea nosoerga]VVE38684.1 chemotaxis protein CheA [Pandoraea nosoerga]
MTIRHRITLLVILTFVALSIIGGYAVYQTRASAQKVRQVTEGVVPSALASADLVSQVKAVQIATMTLVYAPDGTVVEQALDNLRKLRGEIDQSLARQAEGAASDAQKGLVTQARESVENYFNAIAETARLKQAGKTEMAQAFLFAMVAQYRDELEGVVNTLRVEKNRQKDSAIATLNDTLSTTTTAIGLVTGLAIVLLTAVGALLYRQITRPLSRMQAMMSEIASSQDFTRRVPVGRMDEIGHSIVAFNGMIEKIQERSAQLKQKTADIQAMLQNMQQGILTVIDGSKVHGEYSAYLEAIFETKDIAGRPVMELVFGDSDLGSDALSQVEAAIDACIGQDAVNFAFNEHLLVGEIGKRMADGRVKQLDLTWSAITDENDTILRLMLCVRDVTELRELAAEANEQKQRLEMIGEILAVSQEKFHHFIESSTSFIRENERIIRKHSQADSAAIAELFRNMHTIKGNARTYNLQYLTNVVHETEQRYHELRQPDVARQWDQDGLMRELQRVREAVDTYARINEMSLGRKGPGKAADEQTMVVDRAHIRASLRMLEAADPNDLRQLVAMRDAVHQTLRLLGTEGVGEALGGVLDSLPSLAAELGKPAPVVRIDDNGYRLRPPAVRILRDVFMHLLRNSMDHGLESAEERRASGKPEAGTIDIEVGLDHNMLQVTLTDDGRGLALHRIRGIAVQRGWITEQTYVSDEQIAQFIFRPGFSTASQVTEVSGRGVGMDAVQDFVRREHGRIELRFTDERKGAEYRQFQTVVCLPDNLVVDGFDLNSVAADAVDPPAFASGARNAPLSETR